MPYNHRSNSRATEIRQPACRQCEIYQDSLCAVVSDDEIARIESIATHVNLRPGRVLFDEGDKRRFVYIVVAGVMRLVKLLTNGRRQITGFLFPGDHLGMAAHNTYSCIAEAVTEVHLCRFRTAKLEALIDDLPDLGRRLFGRVYDELAAAQGQITLLGRKNSTEKLTSFLLLMSERNVKRGLPPSPVTLPMHRADIADYLGLTKETVSRTFSQLKEEGILSLPSDYTVVLENSDLLEKLTGET